jgi:hypothetical protein
MIEYLVGFGLPPIVAVYAVAVLGSLAIELAAPPSPERYRTISYPVFRILFAFVAAGPLAVLLSARTDWNAFYVGLTAPLIFDRAAAGIKTNNGDPG